MSSRKLATMFLLLVLAILVLGMSFCLDWIQENRTPVVRPSPAQPIYVLGRKKAYDDALLEGKKPLCPGPIPLLYGGALAFKSAAEARQHLVKYPKAYPRSQYDVYRLSGDFALDTCEKADLRGAPIHITTCSMQVEAKAGNR